ncbi:UvrD-helicase domain-containing protein [Pseudomonadota bacterium]
MVVRRILDSLDSGDFDEADRLYKGNEDLFAEGYFESEKNRLRSDPAIILRIAQHEKEKVLAERFFSNYCKGSLNDLDRYIREESGEIKLSHEEYASLKKYRVDELLSNFSSGLDPQQRVAVSAPEKEILISARAGSGKTHTLAARAAISILDEALDPNQILVLAFNKSAANEIKNRIRSSIESEEYENARTFHSLAYQLVKPEKSVLYDEGDSIPEKKQSVFVNKLFGKLLNPAFKDLMYQYFRHEISQIERIGLELSPSEYRDFRRNLEYVTLGGERVKSYGEKFIADFLFEHDITYRYERAWVWKFEPLDNSVYRPDFSLLAEGKDVILEHWAIDPDDPNANLPDYWDISVEKYQNQIKHKREFWRSKQITLLETHNGMLSEGRESFESKLEFILERAGIYCEKLPDVKIIDRVFSNEFEISRMAVLLIQFIQRCKKQGWSFDNAVNQVRSLGELEPKLDVFYKLGLRTYRAYQEELAQHNCMDFDDLLVDATSHVKKTGERASIHLGAGNYIFIGEIKWLLLDEFQDFSKSYYRLVKAILDVNPEIRLVAVGDDWQAINSFAGADLRFFTEFSLLFHSSVLLPINTNYRSDKKIIQAGNFIMRNYGNLANSRRGSKQGNVEKFYIDKMRILFSKTPYQGKEQEWEHDRSYFSDLENGKGPSERQIRQAQALKKCVELLKPIFDQDKLGFASSNQSDRHQVLVLSRTGRAYGMRLNNFKAKLIELLSSKCKMDKRYISGCIDVITAHKSKGQQADTVILTDVVEREYPKIHPDNMLFELFGVTIENVLAEERRLFYVAMTRAKHNLYVLTQKNMESPFLSGLVEHQLIEAMSGVSEDGLMEPLSEDGLMDPFSEDGLMEPLDETQPSDNTKMGTLATKIERKIRGEIPES